MRLKLQNGESIEYKVPTVRVQDYSLEEIEERKLVLFLPFLILRYTEKLKNKKRPTEEEIPSSFIDSNISNAFSFFPFSSPILFPLSISTFFNSKVYGEAKE